jgi:glycosyltransferase involved in cell wall biosynthesis
MADISDPAQLRQLLESANAGATMPQRERLVTRSRVTDIDSVRQMRAKPLRSVQPATSQRRPGQLAPKHINLCLRRPDWLFGDLVAHFTRNTDPRIRLVVTERPVQTADGWLFIRTHEANATPDPSRTVVQIHDNLPARLYKPGGERTGVRHCRGIVLTHPSQRDILLEADMTLDDRQVLCEPPGALETYNLRDDPSGRPFTLGWIGRPTYPGGIDIKGIGMFLQAVKGLGKPLRLVLLGERLDEPYELLRRAGVDCVYHRRSENPIARYPDHYRVFDCVAISSMVLDGPPMPLFEALATGVPVVSTRVGWAPELIRNDQNGYLVDDAEQMTAAILRIREQRDQWFERRDEIRTSLPGLSLEAWLKACLELTLDVVNTAAVRPLQSAAGP